ncbi:uncharacterized protein LOC101850850 [Aplysia californica]|uniref:Uncharacterized protein LOC101850850 n=1 Tax=Aplysia californica TaxID=6500 RepID=A0ABM1AB01_APLCA|nr:uncharacterized protein LOC101850850 [Aplysia californica]
MSSSQVAATMPDNGQAPVDKSPDVRDFRYDHGWAWMVALGSFLGHFIYYGLFVLYSVLLLDIVEHYDSSVAVVTLIPALNAVVFSTSTQLWSTLLPLRHFRKLAVTAAVANSLFTTGLMTAPTVHVFITLFLCKSFCHGTTLINSLALLNHYFKHRRGLATSLAMMGLSCAPILLPPIFRFLKDEYGFQGCLLIFCAFELNAVFAALLFRPVEQESHREGQHEDDRKLLGQEPVQEDNVQLQTFNHSEHDLRQTPGSRWEKSDTEYVIEGPHRRIRSETKQLATQNSNNGCVILPELTNSGKDSGENSHRPKTPMNDSEISAGAPPPIYIQSEFCTTSESEKLNIESKNKSSFSSPSPSPRPCCSKVCRAVGDFFKRLLDPKLLRRPIAILLLFSQFLNFAGMFITAYLPSHTTSVGVSKQNSALLFTLMGVVDMVSRFGYGYLADLKLFRVSQIIAATVLCMGILCHCIRFFQTLESLIALVVLTGGLGFAQVGLGAPLITEILGVENLGKMLASCTLVMCLLQGASYPVLGMLIEATGSFYIVFHFAGVCYLAGGTLLLVDTYLARKRRLQADVEGCDLT